MATKNANWRQNIPRWQEISHPKYQAYGKVAAKGGFQWKGNNFGKGGTIQNFGNANFFGRGRGPIQHKVSIIKEKDLHKGNKL